MLDTAQYKKQGMDIALTTFGVLSGQLKQAMQAGGVAHAATYCNTAAYPLVDSMSAVYGAQVRRVSQKLRNPADAPNEREAAMLAAYHERKAAGGKLGPEVRQLENGEVAFYAPILTQELCLKCHGDLGGALAESDYETIKTLYPEDEAIGYAAGDLRGMWSITFPAPGAGQ